MIRRSFSIAVTVFTLVGIISAQTPTYKTYTNARFDYSISYPSLLQPQGEAANADGQAFRASDGRAEMRVWGQHNVNNESLRAAYNKTISEWGSGVSYKVLRADWFAISALVKGRIHYRKTILRRGVFKTFEIEYDESQKSIYDPVTARVVKSFVG